MPGSGLWHEVRRADRVNPFRMRHELAGSEASRRTPQLFDQRRAVTAVEEARDVRRLLRVERSRHAAPTLFVNPCANMGDDRRGKRRTSIPGLQSIVEPWADTTSPAGRMVLTVFAGIAEFERSLIATRTEEGRRAAQARGVPFGRPP